VIKRKSKREGKRKTVKVGDIYREIERKMR